MMIPYELIRKVRFIDFSIRLLITDDKSKMGYILGKEVVELNEYSPKSLHNKYWSSLIQTIEYVDHDLKMSFRRIKND